MNAVLRPGGQTGDDRERGKTQTETQQAWQFRGELGRQTQIGGIQDRNDGGHDREYRANQREHQVGQLEQIHGRVHKRKGWRSRFRGTLESKVMISTDSAMQDVDKLVSFAHGKESGPWGIKITRLAEVARARGFAVDSPDYSRTHDPRERVQQLLGQHPRAKTLVLCGSSMGGYVSAQACATLRPTALFLMAPALYFPNWDEEPAGIPALAAVAHGWRDDIVPVEAAWRFAQRNRAALHVLDAGHDLNDQLEALCLLFDDLLARAERNT